ncbi:phosphotransferase [Sphingomonas sp. MMS24-JH45]
MPAAPTCCAVAAPPASRERRGDAARDEGARRAGGFAGAAPRLHRRRGRSGRARHRLLPDGARGRVGNPTQGLPALHAGDPATRRRMGEAMVDAIVALSRVDPDAVAVRPRQARRLAGAAGAALARAARWLCQVRRLERYRRAAGRRHDLRLAGGDRPATMRPGLDGDFHLANVMFRPDVPELAAVVDWELASRGDPLLDLGWLTATWRDPEEGEQRVAVEPWEGFPDLGEIVDRYLAATGRTREDARWYTVLAPFKLGAILEGSHARACAGLTPKAIGDQLHAHTIALFERALRRIERPIV